MPTYSPARYSTALLIALCPLAASAEPACSPAALARPLVNHLFARKDYGEAIARLEAAMDRQSQCSSVPDRNWYWLRSDLALAYLKAGREQDCRKQLQPLINNPRSSSDVNTVFPEDAKLIRALETNQRLCNEAHEKRLANFTKTACQTLIPGALARALTPYGTCMAVLPAPSNTSGACPSLVEWQGGKQLRQLHLVASDDNSPLGDASLCCKIHSVRVARADGKLLLRLQGEGRDCFGGTAYDVLDATYELNGSELKALDDFSLTY
ncbi:tetratricopeptide repeat protein [Pseudomonas sp. PDNC002]|uniref:tetratricopeptide repeat protein n=1 Tax=Pseudomonas sp. PDNC002 TaxID=2811422 RepID=UPI00196403FA|nr:tetratricopeptide repeat protein [Pseudomonas sp. PDNC002]QRY81254.1 tetratricopeptide repeat protein [Pseudomonas sp. PDNC002]